MKLLFVSNSLNIGGKEKQLLYIIKHLTKHTNFEILFVTRINELELIQFNNLKIKHYSYSKSSSIGFIVFLRKIIKESRPQIIHTWEGYVTSCLILSKLFLKTKLINGEIRYSQVIDFKHNLQVKFNSFFSDYVVANSYAGLNVFNLTNKSKHFVIHNGISLPTNKLNKKSENEKTINIGMVANFSVQKDYKTLLSVALQILSINKNINFYFIGDGKERLSIINKIPQEFKNNIFLPGRLIDINTYLEKLDIGILLSKKKWSEGISNSIMEYMSYSLPVIATNVGGNREIIVNNKTGFLIPHEDENELKSKMLFLIENPRIATKMGHNGYLRIRDEFSLDKMNSNYISLYKKVETKI